MRFDRGAVTLSSIARIRDHVLDGRGKGFNDSEVIALKYRPEVGPFERVAELQWKAKWDMWTFSVLIPNERSLSRNRPNRLSTLSRKSNRKPGKMLLTISLN